MGLKNIFGSGELSGFSGSEITASLSQNIQLAGKISKREKVAEIDKDERIRQLEMQLALA